MYVHAAIDLPGPDVPAVESAPQCLHLFFCEAHQRVLTLNTGSGLERVHTRDFAPLPHKASGPSPVTIASVRAHGVRQLLVNCNGEREGDWPCHHQVVVRRANPRHRLRYSETQPRRTRRRIDRIKSVDCRKGLVICQLVDSFIATSSARKR